MARTQKHSEDLLLEAVVRYSDVNHGKIKATELASWARSNVRGLEEVRDYHFTRPVRERDVKTGKITERRKSCAERIDEINRARSLIVSVNQNKLLRASTVEAFMEQPDYAQRQQIAETRETVDRLLSRNEYLTRENDALKSENDTLKRRLETISSSIEIMRKTQDRLSRQIRHLMKVTDETARKKMLEDMGVTDGAIDLDAYMKSVQSGVNRIKDMDRALKRYVHEEAVSEETPDLAEEVLSGIDFSGG